MVEDPISFIRLPDPATAPGFRSFLSESADFDVEDMGAGIASVVPREGAGATRRFLTATSVCTRETDLTSAEVWSPLRESPPRHRTDLNPERYRDQMIASGKRLRRENPGVASGFANLGLQALGAIEVDELPELLTLNLPSLFERYPEGELWYVSVDETLLFRLAFLRAQCAFALTPDMPVHAEMEQLRSMSDLSLTKGIDMSAALRLSLLISSPGTLGVLFPTPPHALVFCFGETANLLRPYPVSFSSLYRPGVLGQPEGINRAAFFADGMPTDGPRLLTWWVAQLNRLFSHACDPTRFTDGDAFHDSTAQTAWMITLERLMADAISLLAEPQATELDRVQISFDLLDKAESLLGYESGSSGTGFKALLRRTQAVRRLREAYHATLPDDLADRLTTETERLFEGLYSGIRENTAQYRLTPKGAKIGAKAAANVLAIDDETLVAGLCRAVRNSSHGLLELLREGQDRFILGANTGGIPQDLPALAPLIALGLLADADSLIDGSWRTKLLN